MALPDEETRSNRFALEVPYAVSLILTHRMDGEVQGLNEFVGEHPPVAMVFWAFRVMMLVGLLMLAVSWWSAWRMRKGKRPDRLVLKALSLMTFSGWVAVLAGWYVTEIGRQPWIVSGVLRVQDMVADHSAATVASTLLGYVLLYVLLLISYVAAIRHLATKPAESLAMGPVVFTEDNPNRQQNQREDT